MLDPVALAGRRVYVLGFDPEASGLPPLEPGSVVVLTPDGTLSRDLRERLAPQVRVASFDEAPFATERGQGSRSQGSVAVVHTLWGARVLPTLAAIRAGVRSFRLVDTPRSSIASNARGALAVALRRTFARALSRFLGRRSRAPWPSAAATLRALEAAPRFAPTRLPVLGAPVRVVHWLPELGPRAEESVAQLEHLVPRTRALGIAVDLLVAGPEERSSNARARRLERLGVSCTFLPPREWRPEADRSRADPFRLLGIPPELVADLEDHRHADTFLPLLENLLGRTPRATVVHGWLEPDLSSASVVGLAGVLAGARVILHAPGPPAPKGPEDVDALCLRGLAARNPDLAILAVDPAAARDLTAWAQLSPGRVAVAPCAVAPEAPLAAGERLSRRRLLGLSEDAFLIVALGDLEDEAVVVLLGVARRLLVPGGLVHVLHAGKTGTEARLRVREASLGPRLRLLGSVPDESEYLGLADVVLGLDRSARSSTLARAQALGTPVVAADADGAGAVFEEGASGLSFPRGDAEAAADRVERLARDRPLRQSMAERARAIGGERLGPERFLETVLALYRT